MRLIRKLRNADKTTLQDKRGNIRHKDKRCRLKDSRYNKQQQLNTIYYIQDTWYTIQHTQDTG